MRDTAGQLTDGLHFLCLGQGRLALFKRLLLLDSLGDVANRAKGQNTVLCLQRTQTNFDRKFAAVLAPAVKLQSRTHAPGTWVGKEACAVVDMPGVKSIRQEYFYWPTDKLCPGIAEENFRLCVY